MKVKDQQTTEHQGQESANQPARKERGDFEFIEFIALRTKKKKEGMDATSHTVGSLQMFSLQAKVYLAY
jgi:hypothetical protein